MESPWQGKTYLFKAASLLSRKHVKNGFKIFPKKYCGFLYVKGLKSYQLSKLVVWQKILPLGQSRTWRVKSAFESQTILIILNIWWSAILQPFNPQRLKAPLWKDLESVNNIVSAQETGNILKIGFVLSKRPQLHRAFMVTIFRLKTLQF